MHRHWFLKYAPDQPRDDNGRWTDTGLAAGGVGPVQHEANGDFYPLPDRGHDRVDFASSEDFASWAKELNAEVGAYVVVNETRDFLATREPGSFVEQAAAFVRERGARDGYEHMIAVDNSNPASVIAYTVSDEGSVKVSPALKAALADPNAEITIMHNHPNHSVLSPGDLYQIIKGAKATIFNTTPGGAIYGATLTPEFRAFLGDPKSGEGKGRRDDTWELFKQADTLTRRLYDEDHAANLETKFGVKNEFYSEIINASLSMIGIIDYTGKRWRNGDFATEAPAFESRVYRIAKKLEALKSNFMDQNVPREGHLLKSDDGDWIVEFPSVTATREELLAYIERLSPRSHIPAFAEAIAQAKSYL